MTLKHYVLDIHGTPVHEPDERVWARWMDTFNPIIAKDTLTWGTLTCTVTTEFLGMAVHSDPLHLWASDVQGLRCVIHHRCAGNREQAQAMHATTLIRVREFMHP